MKTLNLSEHVKQFFRITERIEFDEIFDSFQNEVFVVFVSLREKFSLCFIRLGQEESKGIDVSCGLHNVGIHLRLEISVADSQLCQLLRRKILFAI